MSNLWFRFDFVRKLEVSRISCRPKSKTYKGLNVKNFGNLHKQESWGHVFATVMIL